MVVDDKDASFSGRGSNVVLYRCSNGMILNADCHAAANIMRKAIPDIWKIPEIIRFFLLTCVWIPQAESEGIPVKGIAA